MEVYSTARRKRGLMLDDVNVLQQHDTGNVLGHITELFQDTVWEPNLLQTDHDNREIRNVVIAGMGGSALAAQLLVDISKSWLGVPVEIVRGYELPGYAWQNTLVIASSQSGNTEETLACYDEAHKRGCETVVLTAGGALLERAEKHGSMIAKIPQGGQPRMATIKHLRSLLAIFETYKLLDGTMVNEIAAAHDWLRSESRKWHRDVPIHENPAKQMALEFVGKTPVIYGGPLTSGLAYKWKISWNENAKNTSFCNQYPEFNHNEFIGWSSHPIEKPFAIIDLVSDHESKRIIERMQLSDRLLSGKRPKARTIHLEGKTLIEQLLWGCILADMVSCYVAVLNGVNPEPVELVERFKKELS